MKTSDLGVATMYRILKKCATDDETGESLRISEEAANELRKVLEDIATEIAKNAADMSRHAKRRTIRAEDVKLASKTSGKI